MKKSAGFTLLELSIALTIIALVVGGIMTGTSMIHSANLQSIISETEKYTIAFDNFQNQYQSLPGDMPDAINVWGAAHATPATCENTASTGPETCNGDGNASIDNEEGFRAWQHLANSELIEGQFTGVAGSAGIADHDFGTNAPKATFGDGVGWGTTYTADFSGGANANFFAYSYLYDGYLTIGSDDGIRADGGFLSPSDALNIDIKIDDQKPGTGNVITTNIRNCTDASGPTDFTASYEVSSTDDTACALLINGYGRD